MKKIIVVTIAMISLIAASTVFAQPGTLTRIAGQYHTEYNGEGIIDTMAGFGIIRAFCRDAGGNIYLADRNYRIRKIDALSHQVTTIAGTGLTGHTGDGGAATSARIGQTQSICIDPSGNLLIADSNRVRKINTTSGIITTVAGGGTDTSNGAGALSASLSIVQYIYADNAGNIYMSMYRSAIKKVEVSASVVTTVAGNNNSYGYSGDGGPAVNATITNPGHLTKDNVGNLYFVDGTVRIRKIDTLGTITTIVGANSSPSSAMNPTNEIGELIDYGEGRSALNAETGISGGSIYVDNAGNIYFGDTYVTYGEGVLVIRKIDAQTGVVNKIAGQVTSSGGERRIWGNTFIIEPTGSILIADVSQGYLTRLTNFYSAINTLSLTDSLVSAPCTLPATYARGVYGTLTEAPAAGDSVHLLIRFGDETTMTVSAPYWTTTDPVTGSPIYGFGSHNNWLGNHDYNLPGTYIARVFIKTLHGYEDLASFPTLVHSGSVCDSGITDMIIMTVQDSLITAACTPQAYTLCKIKGFVAGSANWQDSVYLRIPYGYDSVVTVVVPINTTPVDGMTLPFPYTGWYDTVYYFTCNYTRAFGAPGVYNMYTGEFNSYMESAGVSGYLNNGSRAVPVDYSNSGNAIILEACNDGGSIDGSLTMINSVGSSCPNTIPYSGDVTISGTVHGDSRSETTIPLYVNFGDGSDTTVLATTILDPLSGGVNYSVPVFHHTYTIPGSYVVSAVADTAVVGISGIVPQNLNLFNSCSPIAGTFFIDNNNNCIADSGEARLAYWPFIVVNNTTGDTINAWCDEHGDYNISLTDVNNYTIIGMHSSYFGGADGSASDSLTISCPSTGTYNVTAGAGLSFSQNFGFNCLGTSGNIDMNVSGWSWNFVPGHTAIISIWSGDEWGYTCDSLTATISLIKDHRLTYTGMWSGPLPDHISGDTLTWQFSTHENLFDFTAQVRVACDITATITDTMVNKLIVSPVTTLPDLNMANNTYSWETPVRTSWDPNEKEVSPKGYGIEGYIENSTALSYIVHFQNTGTAPADNITVVDTISAGLDLSTLQVINSSASVHVYHTGDNVVKFRFDNINLPDSVDDPEGSTGFIAFNILPKEHLAAGTQIINKVGIYFDYNPAVFTNSTLNTIEDSTRVINGTDEVCLGSTIILTNSLASGIWSATNGNATVLDGVVTGITAGTDTIMYTVYGDRTRYKIITVVAPLGSAGTITGMPTVCATATTLLSTSGSGGAWSSSSANATVAGGMVAGVSAGSSIISYTVNNACGSTTDTMLVTVNPLPDAGTISGPGVMCESTVITVSNTVTDGTWSSSDLFATISASGFVSGVTVGAATISYTVTNGCGTAIATMPLIVNPLPNAGSITGASTVCEASSITLSNVITGGVWSSSSANATVVSGVVSGVTAGSATISYTVTNGCGVAVATMPVTVNPLPDAGSITGASTVCEALSTTLSNAITGGVWSSSSANATISSGVVTGVTAGSATISYSVTNGCGVAVATLPVTVNPLPVAGTITGASVVCVSSNITLSDTVAGGAWSNSATNAAVIGGIVTGLAPGVDTIAYTVTNSCGTAVAILPITINQLPNAGTITGATSVCEGATITLINAVSGGVWSSSSANATVAGGVVAGMSAGGVTIAYSVSNSCGSALATLPITVVALPAAGNIAGDDSVCEGGSILLTDSVSGGLWSSSNSSVASISSSGSITGLVAGTVAISYAVTNSCGTATVWQTITVLSIADCNTGVTPTPVQSMIGIYPNPTNGSFVVEIPQPGNEATITITDITGKVIEIIKQANHELQIPVFLTNLASGTYLIKVEADGKVYRDKVVLW